MTITVRLISIDPFSPALSLEFEQFPIVVGSGEQADLVLEGRWVAAKHCELDACDGEITVRHLGKQRETLVNGKSVRRGVLTSGDELVIGIRTFRLEVVNETDVKRGVKLAADPPVELAG